jgi:FkbM family methyltransferase
MRVFVNGAGRTQYVLEDDPRATALIERGGNLNPTSLRLWEQLCARGPWDLVVDVGANYGEMLLSFPLPSTARVVALEPSADVAACLRASVDAAGLDVEVLACAAGARRERGVLYLDAAWSGSSTTTAARAPAGDVRVAVDVEPLGELLAARGFVDGQRCLLKIDVEGGERSVLEGFEPLRERCGTLAVQAEILHTGDDDLRWMLEHYVMHLVELSTSSLAPVASLADLRSLLGTGRYYGQDAVLSTDLLTDALGSSRDGADASEPPLARYARALRVELARRDDAHDVELAEAVAAERARIQREYESSTSWRLTRPLRALRGRPRRP